MVDYSNIFGTNEYSAEEIFRQKDDLFTDLTALFFEYQNNKIDYARFVTGFEQAVLGRCGIRLDVEIERYKEINAYVILPMLDRNHVFFSQATRYYTDNSTANAEFKANRKQLYLFGSIDLKNSRVGGVFSEIEVKMRFNRGLLDKCTPGQCAAIALHELGHVYTYFEYLGVTVRNLLVVGGFIKRLTDEKDVEEKIKIIKKAKTVFDATPDNVEEIAKYTPEQLEQYMTVVAVQNNVADLRSETTDEGINYYEDRACEQIADRFAVYHGAGRDLAVALDFIYTEYGTIEKRGFFKHMLLNLGGIMITLLLVLVPLLAAASNPILGIIQAVRSGMLMFTLLQAYNPANKIYDDPKERLNAIKQTIVEELTIPDLSQDRKVALLADIAEIDGLVQDYKSRMYYWEKMAILFLPSARKSLRQLTWHKLIEGMLRNDIFTASAKFGALK